MDQGFWVVIPAAGFGKRMGSDIPKQYLPLKGKTVIEWTLSRFLDHPSLKGVVVAISDGDPYWQDLALQHSKLKTVTGGAERSDSVYNALRLLEKMAAKDDWVLVHDAARPCITTEDIDQLITELGDHPVGGVLGTPLSDTVKRTNAANEVIDTPDRSQLWRAFTPQMFHLKPLMDALAYAVKEGKAITDDASAMELAGLHPKMVLGRTDNIKITQPGDLQLAELYLKEQEQAK
ncbi:MAG: 2-C-methyl-D-erythritol 4-phosphate cytidylyltransferase [Gammaproteobacteria bacterium]|nr:2-C-methyl-D-erythritol 4-phosphate cytidylyltransferase [Gammaproteobacteria bacterium]